jgi:predicted permease
MTVFTATAAATLAAIVKIFLVIALAGVLVRRGILTDAMVTALTHATLVLFLPCLILDKILSHLRPAEQPLWWTLPLAGIVMSLAGLVLAAAIFARELPAKKNMLAVASMQNAGYLVLPIVLALEPARFDELAMYVALFILGFNPVLWGVGTWLVSDRSSRSSGWRGLFNPPLVSCLAAVVLAVSGLGRAVPEPVLETVALVGQGAVPIATVVLGATLGGMRLHLRPHLWDAARVLLVKYGLLPAVTVWLLLATGIAAGSPLLARFLVLEAAAAPAVGLILQVRAYGGDEGKVGAVMLVSYVACLVSLPVWLAVWDVVAG